MLHNVYGMQKKKKEKKTFSVHINVGVKDERWKSFKIILTK